MWCDADRLRSSNTSTCRSSNIQDDPDDPNFMSSAFREGSKDQAGMRAAIKHVMTRLKESGPKGPLGKAQRAVDDSN